MGLSGPGDLRNRDFWFPRATLLTYTLPGLAVGLSMLLINHRVCCLPCAFLAGLVANVSGSAMVNSILPACLLYRLCLPGVSALSGGLGGIIAYKVIQVVNKHKTWGKVVMAIMRTHDI